MTQDDFASLPGLLTFTVDVEEHRAGEEGIVRCRRATHAILDFLALRGHRGTFFVLGSTALNSPGLVREIAARGHEIGSHAVRHVPLERQDRTTFAAENGDGRKRLEDLAARPVAGFRAPFFSLTPKVPWAVEAILAAGFAYSSSVLPGYNPAYCWPGAPPAPFLWPGGLLEIPCPVGKVGPLPLVLPCLGGLYLRYLPPFRLRRLMRRLRTDAVWTYCHPYEFDLDEPYGRAPGIGPLASFLLWANRGALIERLRLLLLDRESSPFAERLLSFRATARPFGWSA